MNKKLIVVVAVAIALLISGTAFAAVYKTPSQSLSDLTKIPVEQLDEQRAEGKTYSAIAAENGVLEEYKDEVLKYRYDIIDEAVKGGRITPERAEDLKEVLKERIELCDGTQGSCGAGAGRGCGGYGLGAGIGQGRGAGCGMGFGKGLNYK